MKRILLSLLIGFGLIMIYALVVLAVISLHRHDHRLMRSLAAPLSLPTRFFNHFFPLTAEDFVPGFTPKKLVRVGFVFLGNGLLYSTPPYLLLTLLSRFRRVELPVDEPPAPPSCAG